MTSSDCHMNVNKSTENRKLHAIWFFYIKPKSASEWASERVFVLRDGLRQLRICTLIDNGREPIRNKDTDVLYKLTFSVEEPTWVCLVLSPQFIKPSLEDAQAITGFPWGDTSYHRTPADKEIHYQEQ